MYTLGGSKLREFLSSSSSLIRAPSSSSSSSSGSDTYLQLNNNNHYEDHNENDNDNDNGNINDITGVGWSSLNENSKNFDTSSNFTSSSTSLMSDSRVWNVTDYLSFDGPASNLFNQSYKNEPKMGGYHHRFSYPLPHQNHNSAENNNNNISSSGSGSDNDLDHVEVEKNPAHSSSYLGFDFDIKGFGGGSFESSILPPLSTSIFEVESELENQFIDAFGHINGGGGSGGGTGVGIGVGTDVQATEGFYTISWLSIFLMAFLIMITIVGNVLVCLSVILVRKLRKPQNYLLVSLAVSDLLVAVFVMPFAIIVEFYQSQWPLNTGLCDFWVSADVLCCTASILNLCAISVDRYQAITAPFDYSARSTPRRMLTMIFVVWLGSACVSLPPVLLLGNEHVDPVGGPICRVSQNFWYQIYATMASFYIPLCVMVTVYAKILRVVTDKKKEMNWKKKKSSQGPRNSNPSNSISAPLPPTCGMKSPRQSISQSQSQSQSSSPPTNRRHRLSLQNPNRHYDSNSSNSNNVSISVAIKRKNSEPSYKPTTSQNLNPHSSAQNAVLRIPHPSSTILQNPTPTPSLTSTTFTTSTAATTTTKTTTKTTTTARIRLSPTNQQSSLGVESNHNPNTNTNGNDCGTSPSVGSSKNSSVYKIPEELINPTSPSSDRQHYADPISDDYVNQGSPPDERETQTMRITLNNNNETNNTQHGQRSLIPCVATYTIPKKKKTRKCFRGLKEHKASTTLGIIMTAFITCWLPFFILALVRPIFDVEIPDWISSLFNWLGYINSGLNPIIYATLNRDFRRPFRVLLSFRCATLDTLMRKEFYLEQYGEDTDNHRNKASVTLIFLENGHVNEPLL